MKNNNYSLDITTPDHPSVTSVLHHAVENLMVPRVQRLLRSGVDPNHPDEDGNTPLHMLMRFPESPHHFISNWKKKAALVFELLLQHGANIHCSNAARETPLHLAAAKGHLDFVVELVRRGADVNVLAFRIHPFMSAVKHYPLNKINASVVTHLLQSGGNPNLPHLCEDEDQSVFHVWLERGGPWDPDGRIVQLFLEKGADPNKPDRYDDSPLHIACKTQYWRAGQALLKCAIDVNQKNFPENTALHLTVQSNQPQALEFAQQLIQHGASLMAVNKNGDIPLFSAARADAVDQLQQLLPLYDDLTWCNKKGQQVLDVAKSVAIKEVLQEELLCRERQRLQTFNHSLGSPPSSARQHRL